MSTRTLVASIIFELNNTHDGAIKCVDMLNPYSPNLRPRGHGGVATLWNKNLTHRITKSEEGNERILINTIRMDPPELDLCIINCYFPSKGTDNHEQLYTDVLDQIHELLSKYGDNHRIIICCDLNASLLYPKYSYDRIAVQFMKEHGIFPGENYPRKPTFHSHNKISKRHLDYILVDPKVISLNHTVVQDESPDNSSTHVPVTTNIQINSELSLKNKTDKCRKTVPSRKNNWKKADSYAYKENIINLMPSNLYTTADPVSIESSLLTITEVLQKATKDSVPLCKKPRRKSKIPWNDEIKLALENSKKAHRIWKDTNRPHFPHPLSIKRITARKMLRKAIRVKNATDRLHLYNKIMDADSNKDQLFYKLIAKQRDSQNIQGTSLSIGGNLVTQLDDVLDIWADHFEHLGSESMNPNFDNIYKKKIEDDIATIEYLLHKLPPDTKEVTTKEVELAIRKLHINKASDQFGLVTEHLKNAPIILTHKLADLFNSIIKCKHILTAFLEGILNLIHKKGKDHLDKDNYRGIVISSILSKVFEHIILSREKQTLKNVQSNLQYGFTEGKSPTMAALLVTEALAENKDLKQPTFMAALDVRKAFDVVWQDSLFQKLFLSGVTSTWHAHTLMLKKMAVKVKLSGQLSRSVCIYQGIGQGKILAPENYKVFINPLLKSLCNAGVGAKIGPFYCGCPTCADDIFLITNTDEQLQTMLHVVYKYSEQERYEIHPTKTKILVQKHHPNAAEPNVIQCWSLGDSNIKQSSSCTHLGIDRYNNSITSDEFIKDKIKLARRTAYSLMGAGFHGINGLSPVTTKRMMQLYITPRLLFGLETLIINSKQRELLEKYYRTLLRRLQSLPESTAIEALYILCDTLPIKAQLDIRTLTFFGKIANQDNDLLQQIGLRQLATKNLNSNSWFIYVTKLAAKYSLPSTHKMMSNPITESQWKQLVKREVTKFWCIKTKETASNKSSLKYIDLENISLKQPANIWTYTRQNNRHVTKSIIRCRLLAGVGALNGTRSLFKTKSTNPMCPLCKEETETTEHFLSSCTLLQHIRHRYLEPALSLLDTQHVTLLRRNITLMSQFILNPASSVLSHIIKEEHIPQLEDRMGNLCYALHNFRLKYVQGQGVVDTTDKDSLNSAPEDIGRIYS